MHNEEARREHKQPQNRLRFTTGDTLGHSLAGLRDAWRTRTSLRGPSTHFNGGEQNSRERRLRAALPGLPARRYRLAERSPRRGAPARR